MSAFARAWHTKHNATPVFADPCAQSLLGDTYPAIQANLLQGATFFHANTSNDPLRQIVDGALAPPVVARAAFAERALQNAVRLGATQYVLFGAGYDSFAWRRPTWAQKLSVFLIDRPEMIADLLQRAERAGLDIPPCTYFIAADLSQADWFHSLDNQPCFSHTQITVCSMMGLSYYLTKDAFFALIDGINNCVPAGSTLLFDYPDEQYHSTPSRGQSHSQLASGAGEAMLSGYEPLALELSLSDAGILVYEHLAPSDITDQYFSAHNRAQPDQLMCAMPNVNLCLAVKHRSAHFETNR